MTSIEIPQSDKRCIIPSSWDELSPKQVRHILRLYDKTIRFGWSLLDFNVRVLYYLMGVKRDWRSVMWDALASESFVEARNANVYMLCDKCLGWLFKELDDGKIALNYASVNNSLPIVRTGLFRRKLYGPADALRDLTFGEFRHAATALNAFFKTQNSVDLDECIAHLYRVRSARPNRAGRMVAELNNYTIANACKRATRIASWQKTLIMLWFSSCINFLQTGTVLLDGEEVDLSRLFSKGNGGSSDLSCTWQDLAIAIAKNQTVGTIERVDDEPLYSIISIMWSNYKESKRYEKIGKAK